METREKKNKEKAKLCIGCYYLNVIDVDHNHCDFSPVSWYQKRVNGHNKEKCIHKSNKKNKVNNDNRLDKDYTSNDETSAESNDRYLYNKRIASDYSPKGDRGRYS